MPRDVEQPHAGSSNIQEVELPQWIDEPSREELEKVEGQGLIGEEGPFLRLPSPPLPPAEAPAVRLRMWNRDVLVISPLRFRTLVTRTIKSSLLVAKVSVFGPLRIINAERIYCCAFLGVVDLCTVSPPKCEPQPVDASFGPCGGRYVVRRTHDIFVPGTSSPRDHVCCNSTYLLVNRHFD